MPSWRSWWCFGKPKGSRSKRLGDESPNGLPPAPARRSNVPVINQQPQHTPYNSHNSNTLAQVAESIAQTTRLCGNCNGKINGEKIFKTDIKLEPEVRKPTLKSVQVQAVSEIKYATIETQFQPETEHKSTSIDAFPNSTEDNSNQKMSCRLQCMDCQTFIPASSSALRIKQHPIEMDNFNHKIYNFVNQHQTQKHSFQLDFLPSVNLAAKLNSNLTKIKIVDEDLCSVAASLQNLNGLGEVELKNMRISKPIPEKHRPYFPALRKFKYTSSFEYYINNSKNLSNSAAAVISSASQIFFFKNQATKIKCIEIDTPWLKLYSKIDARSLEISTSSDNECLYLSEIFSNAGSAAGGPKYKSVTLKSMPLNIFLTESFTKNIISTIKHLELIQINTTAIKLGKLLENASKITTLIINEAYIDNQAAVFPLDLLDDLPNSNNITLKKMRLVKFTTNYDIKNLTLENCILPEKILKRLTNDILSSLESLHLINCESEFDFIEPCLKFVGKSCVLNELIIQPFDCNEKIDFNGFDIDKSIWKKARDGNMLKLRKN